MLKRADIELDGESSLSHEGEDLAFIIGLSIDSGMPYETFEDQVVKLEEILKLLRDERLNDNMDRTFGILLARHPARIAHNEWLELADLDEGERGFYQRYVSKGAGYG